MNIAWYTRDGDLDFFASLSNRLKSKRDDIKSFYACHTTLEKKKLASRYHFEAEAIGEFIQHNKKEEANYNQFLNDFGIKYQDIPLIRLAWGEMFEKGYSEDTLADHLLTHFIFWESFLEKYNIEIVISEVPAILSTNVLWAICKKKNILFIAPTFTGIDDWSGLSSSWLVNIDGFKEALNSERVNKSTLSYRYAVRYFDNFKSSPKIGKYVNMDLNTGEIRTPEKYIPNLPHFPKIKTVFRLYKWWQNEKQRLNYYLNKSRKTKIKERLETVIRALYLKVFNEFAKSIDPENDKYVFFTLNILHEWSHYCSMGLKYARIISVIEECASCLPIGYRLYVKEHPFNFPEKDISFYRKIKRVPRVVLLNRNEDTFNLINNCECVINLGGTSGWEAFLLGKPVVILNETWFMDLKGIYHAKSSEELAWILQNISFIPLATEQERIHALYALYSCSFEAKLYPLVEALQIDNIDKFAFFILKKIQEFENRTN